MWVGAVFRGRKKHSNHGDTVEKMLRHMVMIIQTVYRNDVPIIVRMDAGFSMSSSSRLDLREKDPE